MSLKIFLITYILTGLAMLEATGWMIVFRRKIKPTLMYSATLGFIIDLLRLKFKLVLEYIIMLLLWPFTCALIWAIQEEII